MMIEKLTVESVITNAIQYNQHTSVWCKVRDYDDMSISQTELTADTNIIKALIEDVYMCWTPEDWAGLQSELFISSVHEHVQIADEIVKACVFYDNKKIKEAIAEREDFLAMCHDWQGAKASWDASNGIINEKNELINQDFTQYALLKELFLHQLFAENVRFYVNKTLETTKDFLYGNKMSDNPAIIAIDQEKAGLFWFYY